jgi:hypothetical protein
VLLRQNYQGPARRGRHWHRDDGPNTARLLTIALTEPAESAEFALDAEACNNEALGTLAGTSCPAGRVGSIAYYARHVCHRAPPGDQARRIAMLFVDFQDQPEWKQEKMVIQQALWPEATVSRRSSGGRGHRHRPTAAPG